MRHVLVVQAQVVEHEAPAPHELLRLGEVAHRRQYPSDDARVRGVLAAVHRVRRHGAGLGDDEVDESEQGPELHLERGRMVGHGS